jgi:phospholipid/cholesterol/gamma-HCH transport system ATP-binding protein
MELIRVNNFTKRFGDKVVHQGVTFAVKKGECLGLLGGSGSGKSVILRSLIGLEKPDAGEIHIDETEISKFSESQLISIRKKVAYAFQGGALFDSMTVFDNLAYPLLEHTKMNKIEIEHRVMKTLSDFDLTGSEKLLPSNLSGGMQKRVGLARAIIMKPEIILYDEPTAGLDPFNTRVIQETIIRLKQTGVTSILVTHDMPSAIAVCDRILLLVRGKIIAEATAKDVAGGKVREIADFMRGSPRRSDGNR